MLLGNQLLCKSRLLFIIIFFGISIQKLNNYITRAPDMDNIGIETIYRLHQTMNSCEKYQNQQQYFSKGEKTFLQVKCVAK